MSEFRIEYTIQRAHNDDWVDVGFGSSGAWGSVDAMNPPADVRERLANEISILTHHEMAHFAAAVELGISVERIVLLWQHKLLGGWKLIGGENHADFDESNLDPVVVMTAAGPEAEALRSADIHGISLRRARSRAWKRDISDRAHLATDLRRANITERRAVELAQRIVHSHWKSIGRAARELGERGSMTGRQARRYF